MRFRVDKKISHKQLEKEFVERAREYCDEVLATGCTSSNALSKQRYMMQYHEEWLERTRVFDSGVLLPGQINMFDEQEG